MIRMRDELLDLSKQSHILSREEAQAMRTLRRYMKSNHIKVYGTLVTCDNFFERVIFTGGVPQFINYLGKMVKEKPATQYRLTGNGLYVEPYPQQ